MIKCKTCVIGILDYGYYGFEYATIENSKDKIDVSDEFPNFFRFDRFNYCPFCGNKINCDIIKANGATDMAK